MSNKVYDFFKILAQVILPFAAMIVAILGSSGGIFKSVFANNLIYRGYGKTRSYGCILFLICHLSYFSLNLLCLYLPLFYIIYPTKRNVKRFSLSFSRFSPFRGYCRNDSYTRVKMNISIDIQRSRPPRSPSSFSAAHAPKAGVFCCGTVSALPRIAF